MTKLYNSTLNTKRKRKHVTKAEKARMDAVAELGCVVCGAWPVELHHLRTGEDGQNVGMGKRGNNTRVVSLCPMHHRLGGFGVAIHGGPHEFAKNFGEDSVLLARVEDMLKGAGVDSTTCQHHP